MEHVRLEGMTKRFGAFTALDGVDLGIGRGTIHAVLGENGAGKTTLMNILYGLYQPDGGVIRIDGRPVEIPSPRRALELGIGMIHQHFMLVGSLTVTENVVLGLPHQGARLHLRQHEARLRELSRSVGFEVEPTAPVWTLPIGMRQRVEILKALYRNVELLILDEPTSVLTPGEIGGFLDGLRRLKAAGRTILFITHKLEEVMQVADRVTVMRAGRVAAELDAAATSPRELARLMVGREVAFDRPARQGAPGAPVLEAVDLRLVNDRGVQALDGVGLTLRRGEILGVAGVDGNGQAELAEALAGLRPLQSGQILVDGSDITGLGVRARQRQAGIGLVPEDRHATGLVLDYSAAANLVLRDFDRPPVARRGILDFGHIARHARRLVERYDVRLRDIHQKVRMLSGGNQQKLILAREIEADPRILVVVQPCKGLDVGATAFVQETLLAQRARGMAILYISTELEQLLAVADRVAVMHRGRITGELPAAEATPERLGLLMAGVVERAA